MTLTLYSKADCSLCDKAKDALAVFGGEVEFELIVVDIASDPALFSKYQFDIPVLFINGIEAARHFIGVEKLPGLVRRFSEK